MTRKWWLSALALFALSNACLASVVINGTRVVYPSDARDVSIRLTNYGKEPGLVQAWVDVGVVNAAPETIDAPFTLSPPMSRVDPDKSQNLRLIYTGAALPADKESLFWLNVLEVPPKPGGKAEANTLQFAVRSRIKIFYRPKALKGSPDDAPKAIEWTARREGKSIRLTGHNPTPFHASFAELQLVVNGKDVGKPMSGMVAPGADQAIVFEDIAGDVLPNELKFKSVNDYGAFVDGQHAVLGASSVASR